MKQISLAVCIFKGMYLKTSNSIANSNITFLDIKKLHEVKLKS